MAEGPIDCGTGEDLTVSAMGLTTDTVLLVLGGFCEPNMSKLAVFDLIAEPSLARPNEYLDDLFA